MLHVMYTSYYISQVITLPSLFVVIINFMCHIVKIWRDVFLTCAILHIMSTIWRDVRWIMIWRDVFIICAIIWHMKWITTTNNDGNVMTCEIWRDVFIHAIWRMNLIICATCRIANLCIDVWGLFLRRSQCVCSLFLCLVCGVCCSVLQGVLHWLEQSFLVSCPIT